MALGAQSARNGADMDTSGAVGVGSTGSSAYGSVTSTKVTEIGEKTFQWTGMGFFTFLGNFKPDAIRTECIFVGIEPGQISVASGSPTCTIHGSILLMTKNNAIRWSAFSFGLLTVLAPWPSLVTFELACTTCQTAVRMGQRFSKQSQPKPREPKVEDIPACP